MKSLFVLMALAALPAGAQYTRSIVFSGHTWMVKTSGGKAGPGPNYFSDSTNNVWVDAQGKLHMKITKSGNRWQCAEVIDTVSPGHGTYRFYLDTTVHSLDRNVVLGLFTWNDDPAYNHRELDIEFSRWGNASDPTNAQYVVQPYDVPGNLVRFTQPSAPASVHTFRWDSAAVNFRSLKGMDPNSTNPADLIAQRTFTSGIPLPGGENARINLWLFQGKAPAGNGQGIEVVFSKFEYVP